jgi:hypothetical protein
MSPELQNCVYAPTTILATFLRGFALSTSESRHCVEKAVIADDSEVPALLAELQALLAEYSEFVSYLAAKTLNRVSQDPSSSKAARLTRLVIS